MRCVPRNHNVYEFTVEARLPGALSSYLRGSAHLQYKKRPPLETQVFDASSLVQAVLQIHENRPGGPRPRRLAIRLPNCRATAFRRRRMWVWRQ